MLYIQHWKFKPGYHQKGAEKFLATGAPYAGAEMLGRYHAPGSLEGLLILVFLVSNAQINSIRGTISKVQSHAKAQVIDVISLKNALMPSENQQSLRLRLA